MPSSIVEPSATKGCAAEGGSGDSLGARRFADLGGTLLSLCRRGERFRGMGGVVREEPGNLTPEHGADDSFIFLCGDDAGAMAGAAAACDRGRDSAGAGRDCWSRVRAWAAWSCRMDCVEWWRALALRGWDFRACIPSRSRCCRGNLGQRRRGWGPLMFTLSNIGGGLLPWMVGVSSNHFGSLKAGLAVPLIGCATMYVLYLREWRGASEFAQKLEPQRSRRKRGDAETAGSGSMFGTVRTAG